MYAAALPACWARNSGRPAAPAYRCAATAPSSCTPVVWVVWNNYAYASIRGLQRGYLKGRELATDFHNPLTGERYNSGLRGDGALGRCRRCAGRPRRRSGRGGARIGIAAEKPYLIDVDIAADINPRRRRRLGASRPRAKQAEHWHALSAGLIGLSKPVVRSCGLPAKKSS